MADKLTAAQASAFSAFRIRPKVVRTATIESASISSTDVSSRVKKWGEITTGIYNVHPSDRGSLRFPVVQLTVDNTGGYFGIGGPIFPGGVDDFDSAMIHIAITVGGVSFFAFDGRILQPEYTEGSALELVAEHPLAAMGLRRWTLQDRIGGDTGIDWYFV